MITQLGIATLASVSLNTSNISLEDYVNMISVENNSKSAYTQYYDKNTNFKLSKEDKEKLNISLSKHFNIFTDYKCKNQEVFENNFDSWVIRESENILFLVDHILNMSLENINEFKKEAKYYKNYKSLSDKLLNISKIWEDVYSFTINYKERAVKANEANKFINNFISNNQEVLKALA